MANKVKPSSQVIFSDEFNSIFDNVTPVLLEAFEETVTKQPKTNWISYNPGTLSCSYCQVTFPDVQQQREHYRLDWHRYNLKRSLQSKPPINEEDFNTKTINDEVSSISGSDSEDEDQDTLDSMATAQGKIFLQNKAGLVFPIFRSILLADKKEEMANVNLLKRFQENCYNKKRWAIFMLGGGHFAAAIFDNLTPILHKTFHCYTVRAGQGGSQSSRDGKSGGSHPKSAGSSLRHYNEQALVDHVRNIVATWSEELEKSSLIFYRASGPYNSGVLFGGKDPILKRQDPRLRTIPFSTGRATFTEVKRVHLELCTIPIYESLEVAVNRFSKQLSADKGTKKAKIHAGSINRAKSRQIVERPLPTEICDVSSEEDFDTKDEEYQLNTENLEVTFENLEEFGDSLTAEQRKRGRNKKKPKKSKTQKLKEKEDARKAELINILVKGNTALLEDLLQERLKTFEEETRLEVARDFFNEVLDDSGNCPLHLAAMNEHEDLLKYLLDNQADPCLKNKSLQTPYSCTTSKLSRDVLKKFAKDNPDKYNYNKAQIPLSSLTEEEIAEKKRAQRKVKKEKEKEKKKENSIKRQEEEQKNRFLGLSDREKRALAAERRILNAQGSVIARCFLCGADMAGKVPFEYLENRFCSIDCLKSHRMKNTVTL